MSGASWSDEEEGGGGSGDEVRHIRRALQRSGARQRERALALRLRDEDQGGEQQQEGGQGQAGQSFALLKKQHSESVVKLEKRCMALEDELNYTKKVLKSKDKHLQEESALVELKVQAIDAEYKQSYGVLKKNMFKNGKTIKSEVSKMFYLLSMLEQNTLHGRHLTLSETNVGLLLKLRSSLDDINKACSPLDSKSNDVDDDVDDISGQQDTMQSPLVDSTLLEICKHLEDENNDLKSKLEADQRELKIYREKASKTSLIPHYRAAIVKAREECDHLKHDAERNKEKVKMLQVQLKEKILDVKKLEACKIKLEAVQFQLKEERDKYKSVIYDVIEDKQPGLYKEGSGINKKPKSEDYVLRKQSPLDSGVGSHSRIPSGGADVLDGRESAMQNNLNMLDCEIGNLRQRLEHAAVARTQSILTEVISTSVS